jgi:PncC family amidohydrolase
VTGLDALIAEVDRRGWRLGVAESLTGGLLAARIVGQPGSGDVFVGGLVAYHTGVKRELLRVPDVPVISAQCAAAMAAGAARLLDVDVALAVTGVAGPERQEDQPVGLVYGSVWIDGAVTPGRWQLPGDPNEVRRGAVDAILELVSTQLLHAPSRA